MKNGKLIILRNLLKYNEGILLFVVPILCGFVVKLTIIAINKTLVSRTKIN